MKSVLAGRSSASPNFKKSKFKLPGLQIGGFSAWCRSLTFSVFARRELVDHGEGNREIGLKCVLYGASACVVCLVSDFFCLATAQSLHSFFAFCSTFENTNL